MTVPHLVIVTPTVKGREQSLQRLYRSCQENIAREGVRMHLITEPGHATCGEAWQAGAMNADLFCPDWTHLWFCADDIEVYDDRFAYAMIEAADKGYCPCAVVLNHDGSLQSAGINSETALYAPSVLTDWERVRWTTTPFMTREQWREWGPMIPLHYSTDRWISHRARQHGVETVVRTSARLIHHFEHAGRGAGMSEGDRLKHDGVLYERYVSGELVP